MIFNNVSMGEHHDAVLISPLTPPNPRHAIRPHRYRSCSSNRSVRQEPLTCSLKMAARWMTSYREVG